MPSISSPSILQIKNAVGGIVVPVARSIQFTGSTVVTAGAGGAAVVTGTNTGATDPWTVLGNAGPGLIFGLTTDDQMNIYQDNVAHAGLLAGGGVFFIDQGHGTKTWVELNVDPTVGGGVAAPIGSIGSRNNSGVGLFYTKTGAANTAWTLGGGTPSGAAGGSLTGTYPNPTIAASGVTASNYGDGTHVATFTVNAEGRVTAASSVAISFPAAGANTTLSNLGTTSINANLIPVGNAVINIGTHGSTGVNFLSVNAQSFTKFSAADGDTVQSLSVSTTSVSGQGGGARSDDIQIFTGASSGTSSGTGALDFETGANSSSVGHVGNITIKTGNDTATTTVTGSLSLTTGNSTSGPSGNINLTTGTAGTLRGTINMVALFAVLPIQAADPAATPFGGIYYNSVSNTIRWCNGSVWATLT